MQIQNQAQSADGSMSSKRPPGGQSAPSQPSSQLRSQERPDSGAAAPKLMYTVAERAQKAGLGKVILPLHFPHDLPTENRPLHHYLHERGAFASERKKSPHEANPVFSRLLCC